MDLSRPGSRRKLADSCPDEESFRKVLTSGNQLLTLPVPGMVSRRRARPRDRELALSCRRLVLIFQRGHEWRARAPALFSSASSPLLLLSPPPSPLVSRSSGQKRRLTLRYKCTWRVENWLGGSGHRHRMKSSEPESEILWGINV